MFLGHFAVGLAARRVEPRVSLGTWFLSVQLVDLVWPFFLLLGLEHVRIAPGITAFTPLDFYHYPYTHSLVGGMVWAALLGGVWLVKRGSGSADRPRARSIALLLAAGVLSHWFLDVLVHRPDMPVVPGGPYLGLGLWHSVRATLAVELTMFGVALAWHLRAGSPAVRRVSFWLLVAFLLIAYSGAAFGPPPQDVRMLAFTGLALWLLIPWAYWADR